MKNFGFTDLVIAGARPQRMDDISSWWAAGADDVVRNARRVATLEEALNDCHLTVATTAARSRRVYDHLDPAGVAELAASQLADEHRIAVIFGREQSGLTNEEIALCQRTASIPTDPSFATMNLAQSVAVFSYELRARRSLAVDADPAPSHLVQQLQITSREVFERVDFIGDKDPVRICGELQSLAGRAALSRREAALLLRLMQKVREKVSTSPEC